MPIRWHGLVLTLAAMLGGCSHLTTDTNQFYKSQTYLPLSDVPLEKWERLPARCASGPVYETPRSDAIRFTTKLAPGMKLQIIQTDYSPTRDDAVPMLSEWEWTIPASSANCSLDGSSVPNWSRANLVKVRHLLSGAQHTQSANANTQYFAEAMTASCATDADIPDCYEKGFLDKFVAGLSLNLRAQDDYPSTPGSVDETGFDPAPYPDILAAIGAPPPGETNGLGRWYRSLTQPRAGDLFREAKQAEECSRAFREQPEPHTQDKEVCGFAMASLEWTGEREDIQLPGATLSNIKKLLLLRSGDPLLVMQPAAYRWPLDINSKAHCEGDPACPLNKRMAHGFIQIILSVPVSTDRGAKFWVPIGSSLSDFERVHGVRVRAVRRSIDWLPKNITREGNAPIEARKLSGSDRRVMLRFADKKGGSGLTVASPQSAAGKLAKDDVLFAPGDILVIADRN